MDLNKIIARAKAMFLGPRTEWPVIAAEPATVGSLFTGYIIILAAIPPIAHFISMAVIGTSSFLGSFRLPMGWALETAVMTYVLSLVGVFISMLIVDALAPSFGGEKNQVQALKVVAYSYSAYWVASIAGIIPALGWLIALAGAIYSIYLLNMGLPFTMKNPAEKSVGYTAVIIIVTIVLYFVIGMVVASVTRFSGMNPYGGIMGSAAPAMRQHGDFAQGSTGAALQAWAANVDKASKQMDTATKSGDSNAQANAVGAVLGAALGSGGKVESLAPDRIKPFLPDTLDGLKRTQISVQRGG